VTVSSNSSSEYPSCFSRSVSDPDCTSKVFLAGKALDAVSSRKEDVEGKRGDLERSLDGGGTGDGDERRVSLVSACYGQQPIDESMRYKRY
jgi:hypothetical protein